MSEKSGELRFVQRDGHVEVISPNVLIGPSEVYTELKNIDTAIERINNDLENGKKAIINMDKAIKENEVNKKKLEKFKEWSITEQTKILRNLVTDEIKQWAKDKQVVADDPNMTPEQNKAQKFLIYKTHIARHDDIVGKVHADIIQTGLIEGDLVKNPF